MISYDVSYHTAVRICFKSLLSLLCTSYVLLLYIGRDFTPAAKVYVPHQNIIKRLFAVAELLAAYHNDSGFDCDSVVILHIFVPPEQV